ncbi:hypothetical protein ACFW9F_06045 [Streptomyces sp. NPDC059506]
MWKSAGLKVRQSLGGPEYPYRMVEHLLGDRTRLRLVLLEQLLD